MPQPLFICCRVFNKLLMPSCQKLQVFNFWYCGGLAESYKFMLEGTSVDHAVQDPCSSQGQLQQVAQGHLVLNTSRDRDSTTSLGSLFQCLTTLIIQNKTTQKTPNTSFQMKFLVFQFVPKLMFLHLCLLKLKEGCSTRLKFSLKTALDYSDSNWNRVPGFNQDYLFKWKGSNTNI